LFFSSSKFLLVTWICGAFRTSSQVALVSSILPDDDAYMGVRDWPVMVKLKFVVSVGWVCRCCGRWGRGVSSGGRGKSWRRCCCFAPSTWHCCLYHNRGCVTAVPSLCSSSAPSFPSDQGFLSAMESLFNSGKKSSIFCRLTLPGLIASFLLGYWDSCPCQKEWHQKGILPIALCQLDSLERHTHHCRCHV
jgi:hypothetical protein